jgi:signal peptidase II
MNDTATPLSGNKRTQLMVITALVFMADQLSKYWLIEVFGIALKAPVHLGDNFALVMAWNRGVSFSMFTHSATWMPYLLTLVAIIISTLLVRLCLKSPHRLERIGYAMIVGGALGNAIDRVRFGAVADFFYAHIGAYGWPAFNVADMAICCGVGLLLFSLVKQPARP